MKTSEIAKTSDKYINYRIKCSCGHTVYIPNCIDKLLCSWCGRYVFKDSKAEFKYRLKEKLNKKD